MLVILCSIPSVARCSPAQVDIVCLHLVIDMSYNHSRVFQTRKIRLLLYVVTVHMPISGLLDRCSTPTKVFLSPKKFNKPHPHQGLVVSQRLQCLDAS